MTYLDNKGLVQAGLPLAVFENTITADSLKYSPIPAVRDAYEVNVIQGRGLIQGLRVNYQYCEGLNG